MYVAGTRRPVGANDALPESMPVSTTPITTPAPVGWPGPGTAAAGARGRDRARRDRRGDLLDPAHPVRQDREHTVPVGTAPAPAQS